MRQTISLPVLWLTFFCHMLCIKNFHFFSKFNSKNKAGKGETWRHGAKSHCFERNQSHFYAENVRTNGQPAIKTSLLTTSHLATELQQFKRRVQTPTYCTSPWRYIARCLSPNSGTSNFQKNGRIIPPHILTDLLSFPLINRPTLP